MKRISFFNWSLMLVVLVSGLVVTGCSEDEEDKFDYPMEALYGTWVGTGIYMESDGIWIDPTSSWLYDDLEFSITFYENGKYYGKGFFGTGSGTYKVKGNTITTYVDGEMYLYYKVTSLTNNKAELTMYDGSGDSMKLRVTKKSASSEIPSDEPKEEVELKLDYTFAESGSMTRATGEEVYTEFYDKYIKTKVLTPRNYTLTFTRVGITGSIIEIKSAWNNNDCVRLPEGEYYVNGTSYPIENYTEIGGINDLPSDTVYLEFNETVKITKDMSTLVLNAKYNSFLMLFDTENTSKIELVISNNVVKELSKDSNCYWLFARTKYTYKNGVTSYFTSRITRNDNNAVDVVFGRLPMQFGKYYYFNDMTNSFDIPMMESGN